MKKIAIAASQNKQRLDLFLATEFPQYSRNIWQEMIRQEHVMVNDAASAPRQNLKTGDSVSVDLTAIDHALKPDWSHLQRVSIKPDLDILFENDDVIVINKPIGLVTHPSHAHTDDSVVHRLLHYNESIAEAIYDPDSSISLMRPGIVHRLDKDTSGVLIIAKTKLAMTYLAKQISNHQVTKIYTALLYGWLDQQEQTISITINRDKNDRRKMAVFNEGEGREAKTIFRINQLLQTDKLDKATLIDAELITGRTHQIRISAAHIHHPIIGDPIYTFHEAEQLSARLGLKHQFLHAASLTVKLPNETKKTTFTAPLPEDLEKVLIQFHS